MRSIIGGTVRAVAVFAALLSYPLAAWSLPAGGKISFIAPSPVSGSTVTSTSTGVRLDAVCTIDPNTLAVDINGTTIPAASFLPFSACSNGRMQSQTVTVNLTLPNSTISSGPTSLTAGQSGTYSGSASGGGDTLNWNFDGGSAPATGSSVNATFKAAGQFTVRLQATTDEALHASATRYRHPGDRSARLPRRRPHARHAHRRGDHAAGRRLPQLRERARCIRSRSPLPATSSTRSTRRRARLAIFDVAGDGSLSLRRRRAGRPRPGQPGACARAPTRCGSSTTSPTRSASSTRRRGSSSTRSPSATSRPTSCSPAGARSSASAGNQDRVKVYNASTRALVASLEHLRRRPARPGGQRRRHRGLRGGARVRQPDDDAVPGTGLQPAAVRRRPIRRAAARSAPRRPSA